MIAWAWFAAVTGGLVVLAAEVLERLARLFGWPTRWAWATALIATIAVLIVGTSHPSTVGVVQPIGDAGQVNAIFLILWAGCSLTLLARLVKSFTSARNQILGLPRRDLDGTFVSMSETLGPAVVGLFNPRIVVPSWVLSLARRDRRLVLLHECEHRQAGDQWLTAAAELALVLVPWHVAVWYGIARLRRAIELDCDARVLRRESNVARYGRLLLRCAHSGGLAAPAASRLHGPAGTLALRIRAMTAPPPTHRLSRVCVHGATIAAIVASLATLHRPAPLTFGAPSSPPSPSIARSVDPAVRVVDIDRRGNVTRTRGVPLDAHDAATVATIRGPAIVRFIPDPDRPTQLVAIVRYQRP